MRRLLHLSAVKPALLASAVCAVASWPQLLLMSKNPDGATVLALILFATGVIIWCFVFAWHEPGVGRAPFQIRSSPVPWTIATLAGIVSAFFLHRFVDPVTQQLHLGMVPHDHGQWLAITLFSLTFEPLFVTFAAFDFFIRLARKPKVAAVLTVGFGLFIVWLKLGETPSAVTPAMAAAFLLLRVVQASISVFLYMRGGVLPVLWMNLLVQSRYLVAGFPP